MAYGDETVIALSKGKNVLLTLGALAFVAGGAWMVSLDADQIRSAGLLRSPLLFQVVGWVAIGFFGLCGAIALRKLFDDRPGLVLHAGGLVDNSSGVSAGAVPWSDIAGFSVFSFSGQRSLVIQVRDPDRYAAVGNAAQRAAKRANVRLCGSPLAINPNSLKIGFEPLMDLCRTYHARYAAGVASG